MGESEALEPKLVHGFNIAATASQPSAARGHMKSPLPFKEGGRNASLDGAAKKASWLPWKKRSVPKPRAIDHPPVLKNLKSLDLRAESAYIGYSNSVEQKLPQWKHIPGNAIGSGSWADEDVGPSPDCISPVKYGKDLQGDPFRGARASTDASSGRASGQVSLGDKRSTGDSRSWELGSSWVEDFESAPSASKATLFRGFKADCEAGSFTLGSQIEAVQSNGRIEVVGTLSSSKRVKRMVKSVIGGLRAWQQPEASPEGLGGAYFFMNELGQKNAIVKPCDEEPLAPNNPKGFVGRDLGEPGLKPTVRVGEAAMREVAAFLLDHKRFANVPATVLVRVTHNIFHVAVGNQPQPASLGQSLSLLSTQISSPKAEGNLMATTVKPKAPAVKLASMQEFVSHQADSSEMGPSRFVASDVHKIGILDIRLFNTDRHSGNMLVNRIQDPNPSLPWLASRYEIIPIDHGFCLPEALEPPYFEWMHWPQAKLPFDEAELEYIASLNADADVLLLQQELPWIPEGSLRILQVATMLLQQCAAKGLTLFEIASVVSRPIMGMEEEASDLEQVCICARRKADMDVEKRPGSVDEGADGTAESGDALDMLPVSPLGKRSVVMGQETILNTKLSGEEMMFSLDEDSEYPSFEADESSDKSPSSGGIGSGGIHIRNKPHDRFARWGSVAQAEDAAELPRSLFAGLHPQVHANVRHRRIKAGVDRHRQLSKLSSRGGQGGMPQFHVGNSAEVQGIFEGLDPSRWATFLVALRECIQEALEEGRWQQSSDTSSQPNVGYGTSCPTWT